ncbi:hypothetical protein E2562_030317 [Oryza meyeriana var. granulata]|uniref:Uncharacterized protein n=1 Tax=Oryza meyeriana var. granulata TaxID=110450 RepID=A0A6G1EZV7_9ORYZ|nr:hypothetical protein E2562_030317 [Oryza meyeriana var. granulata]
MVVEIMARLPVKSLVRFKSVCTGWRAMIGEPSFIHAHLRCSASSATHCDGLVLASTASKLYLLNPATRDAITLPAYGRSLVINYAAGLRLDTVTGKYKVVRSFYYRSMYPISRMGMEVFTVGEADARWRKTITDPPYPVRWMTALFVHGGHLFWCIDRRLCPDAPRGGLLRLSLQDEAFGVTILPNSLDVPALDDNVLVDVLHGELCVVHAVSDTAAVTIWTLSIAGGGVWRWERRYCIRRAVS